MSFLSEIQSFSNNLKPTETKVKHLGDIIDFEGKGQLLGHGDEEAVLEHFDAPQEFREKCVRLAELIKEASSVVVYTGAGISTSAKIPDYRGPDGVWTNHDKGTKVDDSKYLSLEHAIPTLSHMSLAKLIEDDVIDYIVSTNLDGLHMRSGVPKREKLAELHGNCYLELCEKCGKEYLRGFDCNNTQTQDHANINRHFNGRYCEDEDCDGMLLDSIIHFGEDLPAEELHNAEMVSMRADLAIVLGTSMMVEPACLLPDLVYSKANGKMVICNLQSTPYDENAEFLIKGHLDDIWYLTMEALEAEIPMTTPEGHSVTPYTDEIDSKHLRKIEETNAKLKSIRARKE